MQYCPELQIKKKAKDRCYFFNVLNTLSPKIVEKMVYNAIIARQRPPNIENEISVLPEFRDIFTNKYSLIGNKGRFIKEFRIKHKKKPAEYTKRRKFDLSINRWDFN